MSYIPKFEIAVVEWLDNPSFPRVVRLLSRDDLLKATLDNQFKISILTPYGFLQFINDYPKTLILFHGQKVRDNQEFLKVLEKDLKC